jgi:protein SCO1/2
MVAAVAATALSLSACGGSGSGTDGVVSGVSSADDGMNGLVLTSPYTWPTGTLTDSEGEPFDLRSDLDAPLTLVFFGYTRCPDICQAVMANLASVMARLSDADAAQVDTLFVTTDPARDDPATLRAYLDRFNPDFEGLTGSLADISDVAGAVHVALEQGKKLPSGGYEVVHGTPILAVRPDGSVPIIWTDDTSPAQLTEDVHVILTDGLPTASPTDEDAA